MSGLLDVFNKCADDLASMSEHERHYTDRKAPLVNHLRDEEQPARLPSSWNEDMQRMALTTIALGLACQVDASLNESPDCVPKAKGKPDDATGIKGKIDRALHRDADVTDAALDAVGAAAVIA